MQSTAEQKFLVPLFSKSGGFEAYDIEIGADDIVPENFNSVEAICALITRLQED